MNLFMDQVAALIVFVNALLGLAFAVHLLVHMVGEEVRDRGFFTVGRAAVLAVVLASWARVIWRCYLQ